VRLREGDAAVGRAARELFALDAAAASDGRAVA
jgi:hypothetical protein